jgi:hypothetical protein
VGRNRTAVIYISADLFISPRDCDMDPAPRRDISGGKTEVFAARRRRREAKKGHFMPDDNP